MSLNKLTVILAVFMSLGLIVNAYGSHGVHRTDGSTTGGTPGGPGEGCPTCTECEDPIAMKTGEYKYYHTDFEIQDGQLVFEVTRSYAGKSEYNSQFSYGWHMNYN